MLSRNPVLHFAVVNLLTRRASIAPTAVISRSFAPTRNHRRLLSDSRAVSAPAKDRRWVMLSCYGRRRPDDSSFVADANTVAETLTSKGGCVRVSFRWAAPPSSSYLYYDFPKMSSDLYYDYYGDCIRVLAVQRKLVLLEMHNPRELHMEYFVYRPAGAGTRQAPLLSLLPVPDFPAKPEGVPATKPDGDATLRHSRLERGSIGLLRRGENDLLVVHVDLWYDRDAGWQKAVFCVLRPGMRRWELMEPVPLYKCVYGWFESSPRNVICVGGRFLCCIWYCSSFLLCDMADEASPKACYVGLPPEVWRCGYGRDYNLMKFRCMGVAGDSSVRFVSIHPHCCSVERYDEDCCGCGDSDRTECLHPRFMFTIKTWTMNLSMDEPLEWVQDGEIDSEEIWALPGYEGLPQTMLEWPVVCLGKDNVVCFLVSNYDFTRDVVKEWMVELNITTKTLLSVAQRSNDDDYRSEYYHLPTEFQY